MGNRQIDTTGRKMHTLCKTYCRITSLSFMGEARKMRPQRSPGGGSGKRKTPGERAGLSPAGAQLEHITLVRSQQVLPLSPEKQGILVFMMAVKRH